MRAARGKGLVRPEKHSHEDSLVGNSAQGSAPPTARSLGLYQNEMLPRITGLQFSSEAPSARYVGTGLRVKHTYGVQITGNGFHKLVADNFLGYSRKVLYGDQA